MAEDLPGPERLRRVAATVGLSVQTHKGQGDPFGSHPWGAGKPGRGPRSGDGPWAGRKRQAEGQEPGETF